MPLDPLALLESLIAIPGPPGQEGAVRQFLAQQLDNMGVPYRIDVKGNLLVGSDAPRTVVTAHLDEIALIITGFTSVGTACVAPLGGVKPYKWGEGPVEILSTIGTTMPGILSFGSIHTEAPQGAIGRDRSGQSVVWDDARIRFFQGTAQAGDRVVLGPDRRKLVRLGSNKIAGPFLDDRADLVAWLLMIEQVFKPLPSQPLALAPKGQEAIESSEAATGGRLSESTALVSSPLPSGEGVSTRGQDVLFVATVTEETGGEGALWVLGKHRPETCIALELAPIVPDAPVTLTPEPVVWIKDGYATMDAATLARVRMACPTIQSALYSRGGSDASIGQSMGLCAHGITLGFPCENSHGFEIMDERAISRLAGVALALL